MSGRSIELFGIAVAVLAKILIGRDSFAISGVSETGNRIIRRVGDGVALLFAFLSLAALFSSSLLRPAIILFVPFFILYLAFGIPEPGQGLVLYPPANPGERQRALSDLLASVQFRHNIKLPPLVVVILLLSLFGMMAAYLLSDDTVVKPAEPRDAVITLPAAQPWTDSGIFVSADDRLTIVAGGKLYIGNVNFGQPSISNYQTPAGTPGTTTAAQSKNPSFIAPGLVPWSLVGRIGPSGLPFEIGTGTTKTASAPGELYLSVNDNVFGDNRGSWRVSVQVNPANSP